MLATSRRRYFKRALLYWLPLVLWIGWIYYLSDQPALPHPGREVGVSDTFFDYSAHAFTFGVLTWLLWRVLHTKAKGTFSITKAGLGAAVYAASDEIHQSFVMGRHARFLDWVADLAGILIFAALLYAWQGQRGDPEKSAAPKEKRGRRF
ncbi:MAG: VanZ family protein [Chloroflexota bacterium]|nr:VanZ family protein [Chloroflexota bacterium]